MAPISGEVPNEEGLMVEKGGREKGDGVFSGAAGGRKSHNVCKDTLLKAVFYHVSKPWPREPRCCTDT